MTEVSDRPRILRAIKKCLSDSFDHFQNAMDSLDEIGRGNIGAGMSPLVGGYAMQDPKKKYREALIEVDSAEKALAPLVRRFNDSRVNESHFTDDKALVLLKDLAQFDFTMIVDRLAERSGRESVWYRLREISQKVEHVFKLVSSQ